MSEVVLSNMGGMEAPQYFPISGEISKAPSLQEFSFVNISTMAEKSIATPQISWWSESEAELT